MSAACTCKPGTHDDGWQESRCANCERVELDTWRSMLERHRADPYCVTGSEATS